MTAEQRGPALADLRLLLHIALVVVAMRTLAPIVPFRRLLRWVTPRGGGTRPVPFTRVTALTDALLPREHAHRVTSLLRSLVLYHFARRAGLPVRLSCGVRHDGRGLDGHAWLTLEHRPFPVDDAALLVTEPPHRRPPKP